jgi:hypothetical protein
MTHRRHGPQPDDTHTVEADPVGQISFEAAHVCGETHTTTGWRTAAPGLVVFLDGPPNTPCGLHEPNEEWNIWQLASGGVIVGGFKRMSADRLFEACLNQRLVKAGAVGSADKADCDLGGHGPVHLVVPAAVAWA